MITSESIDKRPLGRLSFLVAQESELWHMGLNLVRMYGKYGKLFESKHLTDK